MHKVDKVITDASIKLYRLERMSFDKHDESLTVYLAPSRRYPSRLPRIEVDVSMHKFPMDNASHTCFASCNLETGWCIELRTSESLRELSKNILLYLLKTVEGKNIDVRL